MVLLSGDGCMDMQAADQEYEREKLNERIAKLSGGVAVIQVIIFLNAMSLLVDRWNSGSLVLFYLLF